MYLHGKDLDRIVGDVEHFARSQPLMFIGGAFGLGLLAARFLKSTPQAAMGDGMNQWGQGSDSMRYTGRPLPSSTGMSSPGLSGSTGTSMGGSTSYGITP
jgi:hypothetical protein